MSSKNVYVDAAIWPYGRMMMCHMVSDDLAALHLMAAKIGVSRRWFQDKPGFPHYDICKAKRALAVSFGAIEITRKQLVEIADELKARAKDVVTKVQDLKCRKCGKSATEIKGWLERVNKRGVIPGIWECRPSCDAKLSNDQAVIRAITGEAKEE